VAIVAHLVVSRMPGFASFAAHVRVYMRESARDRERARARERESERERERARARERERERERVSELF
jgi:hypothetical protein